MNEISFVGNPNPKPVIYFIGDGGVEVGKLDFSGQEMKFTGNADASAKVLFDYVAKMFALTKVPTPEYVGSADK